jgi:ClpX C4-type zinc finger
MPDSRVENPPPVLDCARLLHYAVLDAAVKFSGRSLLFVDGKELGAVSCLAICEDKNTTGVLLFHCAVDWCVLGCSAHDTVSDAKARAERVYNSVSTRWVDANVSRETAESYLNQLFANQRCSICGKRPDEVDSLIQSGSVWICNRCGG